MNTAKDEKWRDEKALERYALIAPLLGDSLDQAKKLVMREDIASRNGISLRSLYRYEAAFRKEGFSGLRPSARPQRPSSKLPDNFPEILEQAVQLKREVPSRSVSQIIYILELEGWAPPGTLKHMENICVFPTGRSVRRCHHYLTVSGTANDWSRIIRTCQKWTS